VASVVKDFQALRTFRLGLDPPFHLAGPLQKAPQFVAFAPHELPEFQEADLLHLDARVGLDAPEKIWTPPRSQPVSFGGVPQKADLAAHGIMISINPNSTHN
jgi:hypothetical protein